MSRPSEKDRTETRIFNVAVGTATGWDQMTDWGVCLYDFQPYPGFEIPAGDIGIDFETGTIQHWDLTTGDPTVEKSIMVVMNGFLAYQNRKKDQSSNVNEVVEAQESNSSSK